MLNEIISLKEKFISGCFLYNEICDENEICAQDGLLGECVPSEEFALVISEPYDQTVAQLIRTRLEELGESGYSLEDARTQCLIAYSKLVLALQLSYDPAFCDVNSPENVRRMLQSVKLALVQNAAAPQDGDGPDVSIERQRALGSYSESDNNEMAESDSSLRNNDVLIPAATNDVEREFAEKQTDVENMPAARNFNTPIIRNLGEEEEEVSLNFVNGQAPVLKKDIEHLGNQDTGLEKTEHKIVKGTPPLQKVDGSRVYLKLTEGLNEDQLYQLIDFLDHSIASPNNLVFSDFQLDGNQLSFRASRSNMAGLRNKKRLDSVEGIAEAVYKRRKDIQTFSGVHVDETGIGSREEAVPVESEKRDHFFTPILLVSAFTVAVMMIVMAAHQIKEYRRKKHESSLAEIDSEHYNGKASLAYQDLCRHRMSSHDPTNTTEPHSKHSSTSSWVEEPISQSNIDISTGHVILAFLRDYLNNATKIEEQWKTLEKYTNPNGIASIAGKEGNIGKNRNPAYLPYDDTLVSVQWTIPTLSASAYINASAIHDSDPKQANYIATQSPLASTVADFWQMIWEQGTVLIVNLANDEDQRDGLCIRYWPESGSQVYGSFEIHLVSEHIWSEDYLVRSFYLKNLKTNETRTVTQFHFLTWPKKGVPPSTKALLDFRRKINKSYRGRAAPIVVHSTDGTGRTGTYCLLDMVLSRVARGVKEMNVAGSLEHLRDQRPGMVETCEQYKMVFICLAEEITALVAALPQ